MRQAILPCELLARWFEAARFYGGVDILDCAEEGGRYKSKESGKSPRWKSKLLSRKGRESHG